MQHPCGKCRKIQDNHYNESTCDECNQLIEYEEWEQKQVKNQILQRGKRRTISIE